MRNWPARKWATGTAGSMRPIRGFPSPFLILRSLGSRRCDRLPDGICGGGVVRAGRGRAVAGGRGRVGEGRGGLAAAGMVAAGRALLRLCPIYRDFLAAPT